MKDALELLSQLSCVSDTLQYESIYLYNIWISKMPNCVQQMCNEMINFKRNLDSVFSCDDDALPFRRCTVLKLWKETTI